MPTSDSVTWAGESGTRIPAGERRTSVPEPVQSDPVPHGPGGTGGTGGTRGTGGRNAAVPVLRDGAEAVAVARRLAAHWAATAVHRDRHRVVPEREMREFGASGLAGMTVPAEYGGPGVSTRALADVIRALAAADPSLGQIPQNHFMGVDNLSWAPPAAKEFFYGELLRGARFGSAVSERNPGRYELRTSLTPAEGGYRVNGTKYYSTGALTADWVRVLALDPDGGTRLALVPRDAPGLHIDTDWSAFGQRVTYSGTTRLDDVFVPAGHVVPWVSDPARSQLSAAFAQIIHAAVEVGIAEGAIGELLALAREGRTPLVRRRPEHLAVLGAAHARVAAARSLVHRAAALVDHARALPEPQLPASQAAFIAVEEAKGRSYEASVAVTDEVVLLAGADGLDAALGLDRHWRNARTHTLHDPVRWKYHHAGDYHLNGRYPRGIERVGTAGPPVAGGR
ncbi:acyl-CoA dehydrogenase family protein [Streptomyces sp. NPDC056486]|uniref:acyl-CoA dehydrogenase family protein n=1 Tax=Streptomyces sp. NPDC056486 TaxID=3345835 RepID=UPI0036747B74